MGKFVIENMKNNSELYYLDDYGKILWSITTNIMRKQLLILFTIVIITILPSCVQNSNNNPVLRKIKQSLKIHDDNVNGIKLRVQNLSLRENANFHYNNAGLLDSMNILSDTIIGSTLVRSLKLQYYSNKVRAIVFDTSGRFELDLYFDSNRNITKMVDTFGRGTGFYFTYFNNKISSIKITSLIDTFYYTNFVYDGNNNLSQFIITDNQSEPLIKVKIDYDLSKNITNDCINGVTPVEECPVDFKNYNDECSKNLKKLFGK